MDATVLKFIEKFEREATRKGLHRSKLGKSELLFLQEVWGPAFQFNYDGLQAEFPFKDLKGGQRFADFVYIKNGIKLLIEIDGFTTHARDISPGDFDDHLSRQNDLILSGWLVLRFSAHQVEKHPQICQSKLKQAIGHWWSLTKGVFSIGDTNLWNIRKQLIIQIALQHKGKIKPIQVVNEFNISSRSAVDWLKRFVTDGDFIVTPSPKRVVTYQLTNFKEGLQNNN